MWKRLLEHTKAWGAQLTFWDWIWRAAYGLGALAVGWWAATRAYAEGVIASYGTLGYIMVIGAVALVALVLAIAFATIAWGAGQFRARRASAASTPAPESSGALIAHQLTPEAWKASRLERVSSKKFYNTSVEVDGKSFFDCEFENCTFVYNGTKPFEAINCIRKGSFGISTSDPRLQVFCNFLYQMQVMRGALVDEAGQPIRMRSGTEAGANEAARNQTT